MAIKDIVKFFIFFNMILISCSKDEIIIDDIENNDEISEKFNCINCEDSIFIFRINTLGGEIERRRVAAGGVDPVARALAMVILIVLQNPVAVRALVPEFTKRQERTGRFDVLTGEYTAVTLDKVETPTAETDVLA